ncbi:MAG: hypothetical protein AABX79_02120 [Nanoarchaeota archaeon]
MGFFRSSFVFILGILLFFSFLAMNSFFILQSSLEYDNVKAGLYPLVVDIPGSEGGAGVPKEILGDSNLTKAAEDALRIAKSYCRNQNKTDYAFDYQGYNLSISCDTVANATGPQEVINQTFDDAVHSIYYKEYDCNFWNCFSKTGLPFFLVSEKAREYWNQKFYFSLIASLVLIALILLFIEQKINTPIIVGALLTLSAFPLLKLKDLLYFLAGDFSSLINLFLSTTRSVFLFSLVLGIILMAMGIGLRIFLPETLKKKFSAKDVKEIVKEEIAKEKESEKQEQQTRKKKK